MTAYLAEYVIALADLAEAEGRSLRRGLVGLAWAWAFVVIAAVLLLAALALWLWAIYLALAAFMSPAIAAAATGTLSLLIAGLPIWLAIRSVR